MKLRDYQIDAIDELWDWMTQHDDGNPIINASVGSGKSVMLAAVGMRADYEMPGTRILVVVPQKELLQQNAEKLLAVWPGVDLGIVSASIGRKVVGRQVTYATIGSVYKIAHLLGRIDIIMCDECFVAGTMVSTPTGVVPIEKLKIGQTVSNALGYGQVEGIRQSLSQCLFTVETTDGRSITCTGNHPFFTECGWVKASELAEGARLFSDEELRQLQQGVFTMGSLRQQDRQGDLLLRSCVESDQALLHLLLEEAQQPDAYRVCAGAHVGEPEGYSAPPQTKGREWVPTYVDGAWVAVPVGRRLGVESNGAHTEAERFRLPDPLQAGHQQYHNDDLHRSGRRIACGEEISGQEEGRFSQGARVARVSRVEDGRGAPVYNLQVSGHPSYFANGVLVHNCHQIQTKESGMWRSFIKDLRRYNPACRVIGWTGTPFRGDGVWLTAGQDPLFNAIAASVPMGRLINEGYLCPLVTADVSTKIRTDDIEIDRATGDFKIAELAAASDKAELIDAACDEVISHARGQGRKRWLGFGVTIDHATNIRDCMRHKGVSCEVLHGKLGKKDREKIVADYRAGSFTCLVNVAVATTGFDVPGIDCIFLLRATHSPVLYVQICGRGMRLVGQHIVESARNGKENCLWLDFTSTTLEMGPVDEIKGRIPVPSKGGIAPFKVCPNCGSQNATATLKCSTCGFDFPPAERVNHDAHVKDAPVMSGQKPKYSRHDLTGCEYYTHTKNGSPDCMRVAYRSGMQVVATEYVHFDRRGPLRFQAEGWWSLRSKDAGAWLPSSTSEAVVLAQQGVLKMPVAITLTKSKHPEIVDTEFGNE